MSIFEGYKREKGALPEYEKQIILFEELPKSVQNILHKIELYYSNTSDQGAFHSRPE